MTHIGIDSDLLTNLFTKELNQTLRATLGGPIERTSFIEDGIRTALFKTVEGLAQSIIDEKKPLIEKTIRDYLTDERITHLIKKVGDEFLTTEIRKQVRTRLIEQEEESGDRY